MSESTTCAACGSSTRYDAFEDCYLCEQGHVTYPEDYGSGANLSAGIWKLSQREQEADAMKKSSSKSGKRKGC